MREFTNEEREYIVDNEDKKTLQELALEFNCSWQEVYDAYEDTFDFGEYKKIMFNRYLNLLRRRFEEATCFEHKAVKNRAEEFKYMTPAEIDKSIEEHIDRLTKTLKYLKDKLHDHFEDMNLKEEEI